MTTAQPFLPHPGDYDESIAAADPGAGAPPPAEGTGLRAEEPDRSDEVGGDTQPADLPEDVPFRTPRPSDLQDG